MTPEITERCDGGSITITIPIAVNSCISITIIISTITFILTITTCHVQLSPCGPLLHGFVSTVVLVMRRKCSGQWLSGQPG